jgi:hypothetical protein
MIALLVAVLIAILILGIVWWVSGLMGLPSEIRYIILVVVLIIMLIILLSGNGASLKL